MKTFINDIAFLLNTFCGICAWWSRTSNLTSLLNNMNDNRVERIASLVSRPVDVSEHVATGWAGLCLLSASPKETYVPLCVVTWSQLSVCWRPGNALTLINSPPSFLVELQYTPTGGSYFRPNFILERFFNLKIEAEFSNPEALAFWASNSSFLWEAGLSYTFWDI